jgi:hypothetical protein
MEFLSLILDVSRYRIEFLLMMLSLMTWTIVICLLIYNPAEHVSYICTLDTSINYLFMIHVLHLTWQKVSYMMIHFSLNEYLETVSKISLCFSEPVG